MWYGTRRDFLRTSAATAIAATALARMASADETAPPELTCEVVFPRNRVPLSLIIDDSTCLVNMGHFCMPQFATAWPDREYYKKPWKTWPREIPDSFVREFGQWCVEHGVKGKYSIVPYPACVGWLDRELPGWSREELRDSIKLVRDLIVPNFDIHPEMITHTRVIDLTTGRPVEEINDATMENSYPQMKKSVDEIAAYLAFALRVLKNCELPCEGITTPGGFGNGVNTELSLAVQHAVRDVYQTEIPHYFKYIVDGDESTEPKLEHVTGAESDSPNLTVNIPAGTGDWLGSWDGDQVPEGDRYASADATAGRMVELIERRQPAIMFGHWAGFYTQGTKLGLEHFQRAVVAINQRFAADTIWMKLNEIARYWAAKGLTKITVAENEVNLQAPFAAPDFTIRINRLATAPAIVSGENRVELTEADHVRNLSDGTWCRDGNNTLLCFQLAKGNSKIVWTAQ